MRSKMVEMEKEDYVNFIRLAYVVNKAITSKEENQGTKIFNLCDLYIKESSMAIFESRITHLKILKTELKNKETDTP